MIIKDLNPYYSLFSEYTELRMQENRALKIMAVNGDLLGNSKETKSGVSARVYKNGAWGFASSPMLTDQDIKNVIRSALDNAFLLDEKENKRKPALPFAKKYEHIDFSTKKAKYSQKELIDFVKSIDTYINMHFPRLASRTVVLNSLDMEKSIITADHSNSYSMIPRSLLYVSMTMNDHQGVPIELYEAFGGRGQIEDIFSTSNALAPKIDQLYHHLEQKVKGVSPRAGIANCIMDADLAGILAHEAIGHTTEADLVLAGSVAGDNLNNQIAAPMVNLIDFANTAFGEICPVPVYVDDEGVEAKDVVLIENGILKSFMHNKDSANHFKVTPTGNARAFGFYDEPLIRMRNTAILPGNDKLEEMIQSIDDGYYLMRSSNGQADSTSEFMFGIVLGYEIKNGKIGAAIKDTTISGVAFNMLKTITMISDDMSWGCAGMCGKKQWIPVGMGGPAIKCQINIGGK